MTKHLAKVEALAQKVARSYLDKDFDLLQRTELRHRTCTRWELIAEWENYQEKLKHQYTLSKYTIEDYSQPNWGIFIDHRFHPVPTRVIRMSVKTPEHEGAEDLYIACAPDSEGEYKICDYVLRDPPRREFEPAPEVVDFSDLYQELRPFMEGAVKAMGRGIGDAKLGFIQLHYDVNGYPEESVSLYPHADAFTEKSWRKSIHRGGQYFNSKVLSRIYRSIVNGTLRMISVDGELIDLRQEHFEYEFPNWTGFDLFHVHLRKCLMSVLSDVLVKAEKNGSVAWRQVPLGQGRKRIVLASHRDLDDKTAPFAKSTELNGIIILEFASPKPVLPKPSRPYRLQSMKDRRQEDIALADRGAPTVQREGVDETQAISQWAEVVGNANSSADARTLINGFLRHYREVRIQGAFDSLLLEWGSSRPMVLNGFVDIRQGRPPEWGLVEQRWIGVTRQIDAGRDDDNTALCAFFYFGPAPCDEPSGTIEIAGTVPLEGELERFYKTPFVANLVLQTPDRLAVFAGRIG